MLTAGRIEDGIIAGELFSCAIIRGGFAVVSQRWPQTPPANLKIAVPGASAALFSQERLHMHGLRYFSVSTGKNAALPSLEKCKPYYLGLGSMVALLTLIR